MNRRSFLRLLGAASVVSAAPTYFLPPIGGWKSDVIVAVPVEYTTYLMGHEALIQAYFSETLLKQLKMQTPFLAMSKQIPLPMRSGNEIQFFRYELAARLGDKTCV